MKLNHAPKSIWHNPIHFIACGFGAGAMPIMPGTFGTLIAIPIYLLFAPLASPIYIGIVVAMFLLGIWLCEVTGKDFNVPDHGAMVWDEIVGFLLVMIYVPTTWYTILIGFVLFRLFDIIKPPPIKWLDQKIKGGFGVMLDDVVAAVFAWIILQALLWLLH